MFLYFLSGVHRWPADASGAEHSNGWRTRERDKTDCAVHLRSQWDFPGLGYDGGGAGIWSSPDTETHRIQQWTPYYSTSPAIEIPVKQNFICISPFIQDLHLKLCYNKRNYIH